MMVIEILYGESIRKVKGISWELLGYFARGFGNCCYDDQQDKSAGNRNDDKAHDQDVRYAWVLFLLASFSDWVTKR